MKILQVITSLQIGGAEKLIVDMVPRYLQAGHQVDVLLFNGVETPFKKQLQDKGVRIIEFSKGGNVYNPSYIFRLIPILKKYDVVHTHNTSPQLFATLANIFARTKLVTTEHSTSNRRRGNIFFKLLDRFMYGNYRKVVCISEQTAVALSSYIPNLSSKLIVINNGIDIAAFQNSKPITLADSDKIRVVMVGGFRQEKNQDTLIRAMQHLSKVRYELWLVGDGVRRSELEKLAEVCCVKENVKFWGIRNDIPSILKSSDIVVMSSHWEGFGLAAVEGMAVGKPVIASNVDGLAQVVKGAGILFTPGDDKGLATEIEKLANDKSWYQSVAEKCQQRAAEFDIEKTVEQYLNVYKKLKKNEFCS